MKIKLSELPIGSCFTRGKGKVQKKVGEGKVASAGMRGKAKTRTQKGDPLVEQRGCTLHLIGIGMRRHPDEVVEIGDGRPRVRGVKPLHGK